MATSSSLTIWTTCCAGFSALLTSSLSARSRTFAVKSLTTGRATSASSSARRISRTVPSTSAGDSLPLVRRFLKVSARRSDSEPKVAMMRLFYRAALASSRARGSVARCLDGDDVAADVERDGQQRIRLVGRDRAVERREHLVLVGVIGLDDDAQQLKRPQHVDGDVAGVVDEQVDEAVPQLLHVVVDVAD